MASPPDLTCSICGEPILDGQLYQPGLTEGDAHVACLETVDFDDERED